MTPAVTLRQGPSKGIGPGSKLLAWLVHAYTALGLVCAAAMAVLIVAGGDAGFRLAFLLMVAATAIDSTDGVLARRARVKEVLPGFDGRRLDDLTDFLTYTCLPLLLVWRAGLLPPAARPWLLVPLLASAYGFSQTAAKTDDNYFLGFPSYWNVVSFYLYMLALPGGWTLAILLALSVLTFVPSRYLYPSAGGGANAVSNVFGAAWAIALLVILWRWHAAPRWLLLGSLAFPSYYMAASWFISVRHWRRSRR